MYLLSQTLGKPAPLLWRETSSLSSRAACSASILRETAWDKAVGVTMHQARGERAATSSGDPLRGPSPPSPQSTLFGFYVSPPSRGKHFWGPGLRFPSLPVSWGGGDRGRQTKWLRTTQVYCLMVLETRGLKPRCRQGCVLAKTCGEHFLTSPQLLVFADNLWGSLACRFITPISACIFTWCPVSLHTIPFCACLFLASNVPFLKDTSQMRLDPHGGFVLT